MTIEEILKLGTPRPWLVTDRFNRPTCNWAEVSSRDGNCWIAHLQQVKEAVEANANADMIVLAVNSYEAREALLRDLTNSLENISALWPAPPNCADIMKVNGINDGKSRAIIADAAIKIARAALAKARL